MDKSIKKGKLKLFLSIVIENNGKKIVKHSFDETYEINSFKSKICDAAKVDNLDFFSNFGFKIDSMIDLTHYRLDREVIKGIYDELINNKFVYLCMYYDTNFEDFDSENCIILNEK